MVMTDDEIASSYRMAEDKKRRVRILADLNGVGKAEMERKLLELGLSVRELTSGRTGSPVRQRKRGRPKSTLSDDEKSGTAKYNAARRERLTSRGLCIWCGKPKGQERKDYSLCALCAAKATESGRRQREKRTSRGLCIWCGKPKGQERKDYSLCALCAAKAAESGRRQREKRKGAARQADEP